MHTIVNAFADSKPHDDTVPYVDTTEIWFAIMRPEHYREVKRLGRIEPCRTRDGRLIGFRLIKNLPSAEWLLKADRLVRRYGGVLHRLDIALDLTPRPGLRELLTTTAVLKWSLKGRMHDTDPDGTTYSTYWCPSRSRRNLALYDDKPSRITGELDCVHFELRLIGARIIRGQGIHRPADLIGLNPKQLFDRHLMWSNAGARLVRRLMRDASDEQRQRYAGQRLSPFMDDYVAGAPMRAGWYARETGRDRSQNINREDVRRHRIEPVLNIPNELFWPIAAGSQVVVPVIKHPIDTHIFGKPNHFNGSPEANTA
jgi:hypothetical protein